MISKHKSFREPVEIIVDEYFKKQRIKISNSGSNNGDFDYEYGAPLINDLPESPITVIRAENGLIRKIIYGDTTMLQNEESDPILWQEEFIRQGGQISSILKTFPDGSQVTETFIRENGKISSSRLS